MLKKFGSESSEKYICEVCDYYTYRNSQYQIHIRTVKHKNTEKSTFCQQTSTV